MTKAVWSLGEHGGLGSQVGGGAGFRQHGARAGMEWVRSQVWCVPICSFCVMCDMGREVILGRRRVEERSRGVLKKGECLKSSLWGAWEEATGEAGILA